MCTFLISQIRTRKAASEEELAEVIPTDTSDVRAWVQCYGRCHAWLAVARLKQQTSPGRDADALVTAAIREVPVPVRGVDDLAVHPKSFETLLQIQVLDAQLGRLTARLVAMIGDDATLTEIDGGIELASAVSYVIGLMAWAWTSEGTGLPFKATESEPVLPERIKALAPQELLAITAAAHEFSASLAAVQELIDTLPSRDGGKRPSWAAFFEAVGAQAHADPRELAVTQSLARVIAQSYLASDRLRASASNEDT